MSSAGFSRVAFEDAILESTARDYDPAIVNEHIYTFGKNAVARRSAIRPVTAALSGPAREVPINVVCADRLRERKQETESIRGAHGTSPADARPRSLLFRPGGSITRRNYRWQVLFPEALRQLGMLGRGECQDMCRD